MFQLPTLSVMWKWPNVFVTLVVIELVGTIIALALFSIAQPNLFRTKLWEVGYDNGLNSSPAQILYAFANHQPLPKIPFVWTKTLTDLNVAASVLSMFVLLIKVISFVLNIWFPLVGTIISVLIGALWIVSMYGQMGPDFNDYKYPSYVAWYIRKSCEIARPSGNHHYCILAKVTFADTVLMCIVFVLYIVLGIYSMIPRSKESITTENERIEPRRCSISRNDFQINLDNTLEMNSLPSPQNTAYSPRTLAFNTLDRRIPPICEC